MTYTDNAPLQPEDYVEPRCVLCGDPYGAEPAAKPIPQQRVLEKFDEYMSRRDYAGAERHLLYWLEEARLGGDQRGELLIQNELTGHYRKTGEREKSMASGEAALALLAALDFEGTVSAGTTYVNYATASNAFGDYGKAAELFAKALEVYEAAQKAAPVPAQGDGTPGVPTSGIDRKTAAEGDDSPEAGGGVSSPAGSGVRPALLGGLYNNMALNEVALGRYDEAMALYEKALATMGTVQYGGLEQAVTYLNMANAREAALGLEAAESQINDDLDRALALLDETDAPRDGYYAFVCEKCAPTFSYYGFFLAAEDLTQRAERIYAENGGGR